MSAEKTKTSPEVNQPPSSMTAAEATNKRVRRTGIAMAKS